MDNETNVTGSDAEYYESANHKYIYMSIIILNCVLGVLGNGFFIIKRYFANVDLRTETNAFIVSVAFFDLFYAILLILNVVDVYLETWPFGLVTCQLNLIFNLILPYMHMFAFMIAAILIYIRLRRKSFYKMNNVNVSTIAINSILWIVLLVIGILVITGLDVLKTTDAKEVEICQIPRDSPDYHTFFLSFIDESLFYFLIGSILIVALSFGWIESNLRNKTILLSNEKEVNKNIKKVLKISFLFVVIFLGFSIASTFALRMLNMPFLYYYLEHIKIIVIWINPIVLRFLKW